MKYTDNYLIQAQQAQQYFLTYDQSSLIRKLQLSHDEQYLYPMMFHQQYRLDRKNGNLERKQGDAWISANTFAEVLTLLDLVCDSREDRHLSGNWKNMTSFGLMFHQNLLEDARDPWAELFESRPEDFQRACRGLGGRKLDTTADIAYAIEIFDGLEIALQLWFGDEDFPANLRTLWDENALMYIRYETMHYARGLLLDFLKAAMDA